MKRLVVAVALLAACRGGKVRKDAGLRGSASAVSGSASTTNVPKLPLSEDGAVELRALDQRIAQTTELPKSITLRLERASIRGRVEDYERALADSALLVAQSPKTEQALRLRIEATMRVHEFALARDALKQLATIVKPEYLGEYDTVLAEATGDSERGLAGREQLAKEQPSAARLTAWAAALAQAGRVDDAIAIIPRAAAAVRDNPPQLIAWLLFQWGRIYELKGELATARDFFAEARARLPGYVEATAHLAQAMIATGDRSAASAVINEALELDRHPELLAIAVELGRSELADAARAEWERYVTALPLAFSDHVARFYLGVGHNPARALELARINHANRDTRDARSLVVEAALAAGDPASACAVVDPLVSGGTRAQRFVAWQALSKCGRTSDADRLARDLGIVR